MSTFERDDYRWRETYFVLFQSARCPALEQLVDALSSLADNFRIVNPRAGESQRFASLTCMSPDDYAALDVSYLEGEEVVEQVAGLIEEMKHGPLDDDERAKVNRLDSCDARFDIMHFQQVVGDEDDPDEMFDPSALLIVVDALSALTDGVAVDPQSNSFV